jgi:hypothetical protein
VSSAVELGVSLSLGASEAAARLWKGAELAVCVRAEESVVWVVLWLCVAALNALVPGVRAESGWSGAAAVVVPSAVWGVAVLGCSASGEPAALGLLPGPDGTVDVGAAAVGAVGGAGAGDGLTAPAAAPVTPGVAGGVRVDTEVGEALGPTEDGVAGEVSESAGGSAAGEEVVAGEVSGPAEGVAADEEVFAGEAPRTGE